MSVDKAGLWHSLQNSGLVEGECPGTENPSAPWYVRVLQGFAGWLASIFIIGFIFMVFRSVFEEKQLAMVLGGIMIGIAYGLLKNRGSNDFMIQLALAISLAGQFLFISAITRFEIFGEARTSVLFIIAVLQLVLTWIVPNSLHRGWTAFSAAVAFSLLLAIELHSFIQVPLLLAVVALLWLKEYDWLPHARILKPASYGITLALLYMQSVSMKYFGLGYGLLMRQHYTGNWGAPWLQEVLAGAVLVVVVMQLLQRYQQPVSSKVYLAAILVSILLAAVSIKAVGISSGVVIILLGYANGNRLLTGGGIVALLFYMSSYYYQLEFTLLEKSQMLALSGIVLLGAAILLQRVMPVNKEADDA